MTTPSRKPVIRAEFIARRDGLSDRRRKEAAHSLVDEVQKLNGIILSFSSFRSEISTDEVNRLLAAEERLVLPRVDGDLLRLYSVGDVDTELLVSGWGIREPDPEVCSEVGVVDIVLVPGLAFDRSHHRLGYGRGYYDRLLFALEDILSIGVGFREQLADEPLQADPSDVALDLLILT